MTYFLMLSFVFITLFIIAMTWMTKHTKGIRLQRDVCRILILACIAWASLGTFFFHNIW